ncbi:MAG: HAMP domain-containing sensor histidine kinase [Nitrospiraceae bacterium]|nr:HAMP domain-containing sensor histidine kinase [Nitrospiraceae bacterium]
MSDMSGMATLAQILERIESKKADYAAYNFTRTESTAFKTFFDLAQEYDELEDFYYLCVAVPKAFFGLEARLYMIDSKTGEFPMVSATEAGSGPRPALAPPPEGHAYSNGSFIMSIKGKKILPEQLPFQARDNVLGLLEIYPAAGLDAHNELFFEKYANRIGFNIHNRFIVEKNIEHLKFIKSLVSDIEHNIIVPNMIYKLFLRNLKGLIGKNLELENTVTAYRAEGGDGRVEAFVREMSEINQNLAAELGNLERHYMNMSLFLETLLRRSHFDKGRLTLRTKPCRMKEDVVQPQLERYASQFREMGITVDDRFSGIPEGEIVTVVDVGLMAQVYANLFSNALKYTQEAADASGRKMKYISYGRQLIKDYFGPGSDGIKYNVFNTGPHIGAEERGRLFEDGFRGVNAKGKPGTGHGLAFIKNVIELHGGVVGYEATPYGNNFYFILHK